MTVFRGLRPCLRAVASEVGEDGRERHYPRFQAFSLGRRTVPEVAELPQCLECAAEALVGRPCVRAAAA